MMGAGLGLVAVVVFASGCASVLGFSHRDAVIRSILGSTVQLHAEREGGGRRAASGIVLASDPKTGRSWVLTTRHFLEPPGHQEIYVSTAGRKGRVKGAVSAIGPDIDLAVIEVEGLSLPPVKFKETVHLGDEVWVVAFPWGRRLTLVSGVVSQIVSPKESWQWWGRPGWWMPR